MKILIATCNKFPSLFGALESFCTSQSHKFCLSYSWKNISAFNFCLHPWTWPRFANWKQLIAALCRRNKICTFVCVKSPKPWTFFFREKEKRKRHERDRCYSKLLKIKCNTFIWFCCLLNKRILNKYCMSAGIPIYLHWNIIWGK